MYYIIMYEFHKGRRSRRAIGEFRAGKKIKRFLASIV